ncbi:MAG TPA: hypothetical protein V6C58_03260 [Allocoleopsis sp.]
MLTSTKQTSKFQEIIEIVESLQLQDREILLDILNKRVQYEKQQKFSQEIAEVELEYTEGKVKYGTVDEFLAELDQ